MKESSGFDSTLHIYIYKYYNIYYLICIIYIYKTFLYKDRLYTYVNEYLHRIGFVSR